MKYIPYYPKPYIIEDFFHVPFFPHFMIFLTGLLNYCKSATVAEVDGLKLTVSRMCVLALAGANIWMTVHF